ncbi:hypothetical protein SAV14893_051480 [Streptomyces avermitilis]|uniref:Mandelate racemase/muconate lactonizing enzyme N-terminal domain-containing protein n=1 Tax=Streptomyces avermitilis TaxID=33903 RepID=A0A4D4LXM5_STRAX|nr:hypothetical protein SAV14893_051480 [Streptomyces avermitilis]
MTRDLTITEVRLTPILVADPPLLNTQGVHQPYTPRLIVEVVTADGLTGVGETYGDGKYLELARPFADKVIGRQVSDLNGLFTVADEVAVDQARVDHQVDVGGLRGVQTADKLRLSVVSGFEVACLDALGKSLGLPVHALLGGRVRDAVEYSAYLFYKWAGHPEGSPARRTTGGPPSIRPESSSRHGSSPSGTGSRPSSSRAVSFRPRRRSPPYGRSPRPFPGSRCGSTPTGPGPCGRR